MKKLRAAFIGAGSIAEMHASAFRAAGFELVGTCARPGSTRAAEFARRHAIPKVYATATELIRDQATWDALLICVSTESSLEVLEQALEVGKPILVEKPVALRSRDLTPLLHRGLPVIVGYNRRFYTTTAEARRHVRNAPSGVLAHLMLPDLIDPPMHPTNLAYLRRFFENSVHGLDLVRFIFDDVQIEHVERLKHGGALRGIAATLKDGSGRCIIQLTANWGAPANFSLNLYQGAFRFEMCPFEQGTAYEGMVVLEPNAQRPIRSYSPRVAWRTWLGADNRNCKPGFVEQAQALKRLALGEDPYPAARIEDAYHALVLAERLAGVTFPLSKATL